WARAGSTRSWIQAGRVRWTCAYNISAQRSARVVPERCASSCLCRPGIAQGHAAVEARRVGAVVVAVGDEIAKALELQRLLRRRARRGGFDIAAARVARLRIEMVAIG